MNDETVKSSSVPATASQWFPFVESLNGEFDALAPLERHKRLVERYLRSKGQTPLESCVDRERSSFPEAQR